MDKAFVDSLAKLEIQENKMLQIVFVLDDNGRKHERGWRNIIHI